MEAERVRRDFAHIRAQVDAAVGAIDGTTDPGGDGLQTRLRSALDELRVAEEAVVDQLDQLRRDGGVHDEQAWRYRTLFDTAPVAYVTTDDAGTVTEVNGVAQQLLRREAHELVGTRLVARVEASDREEVRAAIAQLAQRGGGYRLMLHLAGPQGPAQVTAAVSAGVADDGAVELRWVLDVPEGLHERDVLARTVGDLTMALARSGDVDDMLTSLCERGAQIVGAASCGVLLTAEDGSLRVAASSDQAAAALDLLQAQYMQGPCFDAIGAGGVVTVADLGADTDAWPDFVALAQRQGLNALLSVPLRAGSTVVGAVSFIRARRGDFGHSDLLAGEALTNLAALGIASGRALEQSRTSVDQLQYALGSRVLIEQAKGMLAERAGVDMRTAFESLRRHARNNNRRMRDVCQAFIDGELPMSALDLPSQRRRPSDVAATAGREP